MKRWRQYLTSAGATIAVFLMVSLAFAGPGELPEQASDKAKEIAASKPEKTEAEATSTEAQVASEDVSNHGHCVSFWAHESKSQELSGRARGQFISSIAQNEEALSKKVEEGGTPDSTCDFQAQLDQAKAEAASEVATSGGRGQSKGKGRGRPDSEEEGS